MKYTIIGETFPFVEIALVPPDRLYCQTRALMYLDDRAAFTTRVNGGPNKGLKRLFIREALFLNEIEVAKTAGSCTVGIAGSGAGKIVPVAITPTTPYLFQKGAFLAAESSVALDIAFTKKIGAGLFGGEGFLFQYLHGEGTVFAKTVGDVHIVHLTDGETIRVNTGRIVGFERSVAYDITRVKGASSILFSGEGLFFSTLTGPGTVILQSGQSRSIETMI
ncbi:MAG: TIGR00266 family protein [candidate division Zixibacteria bacterium]|nr:TIGR00266 family protein [candidate division Zixibacteria bacterium]